MDHRLVWDRRTFLKLLGASTASCMLPLFQGSPALAQSSSIPRRIVFFYGGDGLLEGSWQPRALPGRVDPTEGEFQLGEILLPLAEYQPDMLLFENLDMVSERFDSTPAADAHFAGSTHAMTATSRLSGTQPGDISIDQFIARRLHTPMPQTQLPSLEVLCAAQNRADAAFASGPGQLVPFMQQPREIYARAFVSEGGGAEDIAVEQHNRVFEFVKGEGSPLLRRLSGEDREKLDQHLQTVDDLNRRLALRRGAVAARPDPAILRPADGLDWNYNAPRDTAWTERWNVSTDINLELAVAALHADITRVVTIDLGEAPGAAFGYRNGMFNSNDPHDLTHKVHASHTVQAQDPAARRVIFDEGALKLRKLKQLLDGLATRREVDGQRLLDHTVVVFVSQLANGSHALTELPWFTVGNVDGYFRTGRWLRHGRTVDPQRSWLTHGRAHNDLFVSLANAMGIETQRFGNGEVCTGPIHEMRA